MKNTITLSNRTESTVHYIPNLRKSRIMHMCEQFGYDCYLPERLFHDLVNIFTYQLLYDDYKLAYNENTSPVMREFFDSIDFSWAIGNTPVEMAIDLLKILSETYNLRKLDKGEVKELETINENSFVKLDDRDEFEDNEEIDIDYNKILKLSMKLGDKLELQKGSGDSIRKQMSGYGDITRVKKSQLMRPDFNIKLALRNFIVKEKVDEVQEEILVYIEDGSSSMGRNNGYIMAKAMRRELCNDRRTIHYYRHMGYELEFYELKAREEKIECFNSTKEYHKYILDFKFLFRNLTKYSKGDIIIVTDGKDYVPKYTGKLRLNYVGTYEDDRIRSMCYKSGGNFIVI